MVFTLSFQSGLGKAVFHLWKSWCWWCHITESSLYIDHSWSKQIVHKVYPLCTIHRYCTVKWRCRKKETDGLHTLIHCKTYTANDTTPVSMARLCVLGLSSSAELYSAVAPHWSVRKLGHFLEHKVAAVYFLPAHRELLDFLESKSSNQSNHVCSLSLTLIWCHDSPADVREQGGFELLFPPLFFSFVT